MRESAEILFGFWSLIGGDSAIFDLTEVMIRLSEMRALLLKGDVAYIECLSHRINPGPHELFSFVSASSPDSEVNPAPCASIWSAATGWWSKFRVSGFREARFST